MNKAFVLIFGPLLFWLAGSMYMHASIGPDGRPGGVGCLAPIVFTAGLIATTVLFHSVTKAPRVARFRLWFLLGWYAYMLIVWFWGILGLLHIGKVPVM